MRNSPRNRYIWALQSADSSNLLTILGLTDAYLLNVQNDLLSFWNSWVSKSQEREFLKLWTQTNPRWGNAEICLWPAPSGLGQTAEAIFGSKLNDSKQVPEFLKLTKVSKTQKRAPFLSFWNFGAKPTQGGAMLKFASNLTSVTWSNLLRPILNPNSMMPRTLLSFWNSQSLKDSGARALPEFLKLWKSVQVPSLGIYASQ